MFTPNASQEREIQRSAHSTFSSPQTHMPKLHRFKLFVLTQSHIKSHASFTHIDSIQCGKPESDITSLGPSPLRALRPFPCALPVTVLSAIVHIQRAGAHSIEVLREQSGGDSEGI
jgi:hypothetical protein